MNNGTEARAHAALRSLLFLWFSGFALHRYMRRNAFLCGPPVRVYFSVHDLKHRMSFQHQNTKPTLHNTLNYMVPTYLFGNMAISWKEKAKSEGS